VELLVVIGILIILTVMTLSLVNVTQDEDRVRAGAAQVQSYLEGARDRAIHAGEPRGVRFLPDTQNPNVATSLIYVGAPFVYGDSQQDRERYFAARQYQNQTTGEIDTWIDSPDIPEWDNFRLRGLIVEGETILQLNKKPYTFYRKNLPGLGMRYVLTSTVPALNQTERYYLHLKPSVLPNQEPRQLPRGVVIDLNNSIRPNSWGMPPYGTMDVVFSPEGTVTGVEASAGVMHLVVADQVDVDLGLGPGVAAKQGNERIVSLRTQTGNISVHNVDPTDVNTPAGPDDFLRYAARGEMAK
jgi:type II secretory pathway pseudopilin PulG